MFFFFGDDSVLLVRLTQINTPKSEQQFQDSHIDRRMEINPTGEFLHEKASTAGDRFQLHPNFVFSWGVSITTHMVFFFFFVSFLATRRDSRASQVLIKSTQRTGFQ
jgi:hypothetical protein